jgi:hypothetical protein
VDRLKKKGGQVTEKRWTGYRKEVDRLQKRGGGQVTEKRWKGYRK